MATTTLARMRQLIGTSAEWAANDLVIADGEVAIVRDGTVLQIRIGDGIKRFSQLPNFGNPIDATVISLDSQNQTAADGSVGAHEADTLRVVDYPYLARGKGVIDDADKIQAAIKWAGAQYDSETAWTSGTPRPRVVELSASHRVLKKILIPKGVIVRGRDTTLTGSGFGGADNVCFESGYIDNTGTLVSNIGSANESHKLNYTQIEGIRFTNFRIAINWFNAIDGCAVRDCAFDNCGQCIIAERSWYAQFENIVCRGTAGGNTAAAFEFRQYVNVEKLHNLYCIGRAGVAYLFTGGVNGADLRNISAESCAGGMKFTGEVNPVNIDSCYFENISGTALDFTTALAHRAVTIDNCWFSACGVGIAGVQMLSGRIGAGNYFLNTTSPVVITDKASGITVEIPPNKYSGGPTGGTPTLPPGYSLTRSQRVVAPRDIYDAGSGDSIARQDFSGGLVSMPFAGLQAAPGNNMIPFCVHSKTAGTTFDIIIDTPIVYDPFVCWVFSLNFSDNGGSYNVFGRGYGLTAFIETGSAAKTVTVTNNAGYLRLQWTSFNHPSQTYGAKGVIRMQ